MRCAAGRIIVAAVLAAALAGCGRRAQEPPFLAFGCGDAAPLLAFFAAPDTVLLVAADGVRTLLRVPGEAGSAHADGTDTLYTDGPQVRLVRAGRPATRCRTSGRQQVLAELWREGAVFTAAGEEPYWSLTAWPDSLVLVLDLGATRLTRRLEGPGAWPVPAQGFTDSAAGIAVIILDGPCVDTMSGAPFPWRVNVLWAGHRLSGCGLPLAPRF